MDRLNKSASVVVDEFDIFPTAVFPNETDPPLIIYSDAQLPFAIADESFQPTARRDPEILHILGRVDHLQLSRGRSLGRAINRLDVLPIPDALCRLADEQTDHGADL